MIQLQAIRTKLNTEHYKYRANEYQLPFIKIMRFRFRAKCT